MAAKQKPILYNGMGQPYLALFDFRGMPIMNPITGIPLGAYISTWNYRYDDRFFQKIFPLNGRYCQPIETILRTILLQPKKNLI